jgi:hypothetical protein
MTLTLEMVQDMMRKLPPPLPRIVENPLVPRYPPKVQIDPKVPCTIEQRIKTNAYLADYFGPDFANEVAWLVQTPAGLFGRSEAVLHVHPGTMARIRAAVKHSAGTTGDL